jgi:hypothetical protein
MEENMSASDFSTTIGRIIFGIGILAAVLVTAAALLIFFGRKRK